MFLTYPRLRISWQTPLNANQSNALYSTRTGWSPPVVTFYSSGIVKDIRIQQ
jgi:hypothetical protein